MSTIVVDADGLIKLGKSGALPALLSAFVVLVPEAVWAEAVEEGKRRMYEDAHVLQRELVDGGVEVVEDVPSEEAEVLLRESTASFGAGERAALSVFFVRGADAVLTDDRAFIGLLSGAERPVPALVPTAAIVALAEAGRMSFEEAQEALGRMEQSVREDALEAAVEDLNAMRKTEPKPEGEER